MDRTALRKRFEEARHIAQEASSFLLSHENLRKSITAKAENDYVTSADKECERIIISRIRTSFPEDSILGEESGVLDGKRQSRWIIDPIDGTVNFMSSFPDYTISIGFEDEGELVFGVVMVPRQNELFSAFRGEGAFLNGEPIHTDETTPLSETLALLVPPHRHHALLHGYIEKMERFYYLVSDMRSIGSAALSLCYVAAGRCSIYYEIGLHIYDIAAGAVILREAGGCVNLVCKDNDWIEVAASSSSSYEAMMEVLGD